MDRCTKTRIVVDIDGVLALNKKPISLTFNQDEWDRYYSKCEPNLDVIGFLLFAISNDYHIILHTARFEGDRPVTEKWLFDNCVPYHELIMGKPYGDLYIDDKGFRYTIGTDLNSETKKLL